MNDSVSEDSFFLGRMRLRQPREGYRVAIDPLLLAAALSVKPGQALAELGCGSGAASLALLLRTDGVEITGFEIECELASLAESNAALNGLQERFQLVPGDLRQTSKFHTQSFDQVFMNPPYDALGAGTPSKSASKASAHQGGEAELADWLTAARRLLRPKGQVTIILRSARLDELIALASPAFGAMEIFPLWPKPGREAKRVILRATLGSKAPCRLLPGLLLHEADGRYSQRAQALLDRPSAIDFAG